MVTSSFQNLPPNFTISQDKSHAVLSVPIEKSYNDDRSYRLIRLSNELEALLIHDANTDYSSAAIDVHVGHLCDPENLQGLAHFCEHLLFMGTEKYPKENTYSEDLSTHGGHSNAYTGADHTNYYFEVRSEFLEVTLDQFAQFFIAPLFDPSCTDRELLAVDSENNKNLQSDVWRISQLEKSLTNPKHPYSKFSTGNLETLRDNPIKQGLNIRDELLKFHEKHYSANIMKLAVLGRESLDQLSQWVVEKFSAVKNKNISVPTFEDNPLTENELLRQVFIKPVKEVHNLSMTLPFPDQRMLFRAQPGKYLSHLIGHEGFGSILSLLKKKGWANGLGAGTILVSGFGLYKIMIDLTESGLDVVIHVFQYIEMLRREGVQERIFREVEQLSEISFKFEEKSSPSRYVSNLSNSMHKPFPREWVLSGNSLIREYNPQLIHESIESLRPDKFILALISQSFTGLDQRERWYGTEYKVEALSDKLVQALNNIKLHNDLKLPSANEFIPTNFETHKIEVATPSKSPNLIKNTQFCRLWHKKDDTFWVPKASVNIKLRSPIAYVTPLNCVKTQLFTDLLKDALNEYSYNAEIAGLSYSLENEQEGLLLSIDGYNDKSQVLLEKIVIRMKNFEVDPQRFLLIKEQLQRSYKNALFESPHYHAMYYLSYVTQEKLWTNEEKLEALQDIKCEDITAFYPELLSQLHIESLIHGNILKDDAIIMLQKVEEILRPKALQPSQIVGQRSVIIPSGKRFIHQRNVFDSNEVNSAIEYYIQIGDLLDKELRSKLGLLSKIAYEPCFDQLRTKEQLARSLGFRVIVQSVKDTIHLENRIESFLIKLRKDIEEMSEQEYQHQVQSLISKKLEKPKKLFHETNRYWPQILSGNYDFEQANTDAEELRKIMKQDLLEFYDKFLDQTSPSYKKLSVHLRSQKTLPSKSLKNPVDVNHLHRCLSSHGLDSITVQVLQTFVNPQTNSELDGPDLEIILKNVLIDQTKSNENEIEELVKKLSKTYLNGDTSIVEEVKKDKERKLEEELELKLKKENEMIDNVISWKNQMNLGPTAKPVVPFQQ
ncbi:11700_t:CDS:10 [Funneliformis geosporum]|uniref:11700_t:CDS:1 n=1 Tax=Funneliformis geosporum TaxID=1117311 RepID=A0A9W4WIN3_9GLOM|nr:11700_t:CDS:10 [Funneliformis geosporum]